MRKHPRFESNCEVTLEAENRNDLRSVWLSDISKGGMFVRTESPPSLGSTVTVTINTPDGSLAIMAEVVHVLDPDTAKQYGRSPGAGLEMKGLDAETRRMIEAYVEGLAKGLGGMRPAPCVFDPTAQNGTTLAARVIQACEADDLYKAIGVDALAPKTVVADAITQMTAILSRVEPSLPPTTRARVEHARVLTRRIAVLMADDERRLDYDFRHGHLRTEERVAAATEGEAERLRRVWHRVFDKSLSKAAIHAKAALRHHTVSNFPMAVEEGRAALELDPFNTELRKAIQEWSAR